MTPHQRILATLRRAPVDRIPVDIWLTPEMLALFRERLGVVDELDIYQRLGVDKIVMVFPGYGTERFDPNDSEGADPWGVPTIKVKSGLATYQEYGRGPFADHAGPDELDRYPLWPDPARFNFAAAASLARRARQYGFATVGPWLSHFEIYCHLRGMENALMDVIAEPEYLEAALDRIDAIQTRLLTRFLDELGELIDIVFISDDMGTQESQLIAPAAWVRHFQPRVARWCELIHSRGKHVLFHSDGACRPFVPLLIESGVDILNPIQHVCPGMDRESLSREFGSRLIFHGGVENQTVLPRGTVSDVVKETRRCLETLGEEGGYIPCSCHFAQAGTPTDNILALIETVQSWKL